MPDRFWTKVEVQGSGCWEWNAATNSAGYGQLRVEGKALSAHRMMAEAADVEGDGPFCLHSCDNPPCVNPEHLRWGTPKENFHDALERGRWSPAVEKGSRGTCPKGHRYTDENTYVNPQGSNTCRECYRSHWREWNQRRKGRKDDPSRQRRHGTVTEYGWGCRCDECRSAKRDEARRYRAKRKGGQDD